MTKLLIPGPTIQIPAIKRFVAAEAFGPNNSAGIRFFLGYNFKDKFLEKIEKNISAMDLAVQTLARPSLDGPIMKELGDRKETSLHQLYHLVSLQPKGGKGTLVTDGRAIIFYIRDAKNNFWAVYAHRSLYYCDWRVEACSVEFPPAWGAGRQVVSRVSS